MASQKVLIWAKTYPELSTKYQETVCTAGCDEVGKPIRIYPLPLRYLPREGQYKLYNWVAGNMVSSTQDTRPESYKVIGDLQVGATVDTEDYWRERKATIYADTSWHYDCLEDLKEKQKQTKDSLGFIKVGRIERVWIKDKTAEEIESHWQKLAQLKSQLQLFGPVMRDLEPQTFRIHVKWYCQRQEGERPCPGHTAGILDWGLGELGRRLGADKAKQRMEELANLEKYDLAFFVGNFKAHPGNFGIIGLWYPMHPKPAKKPTPTPQLSLFGM
jgi:hypothetical protein